MSEIQGLSENQSTRRALLGAAAGAAVLSVAGNLYAQSTQPNALPEKPKMNGRIKQGVCKWCFGKMSLEQLCQLCVQLGIGAIDLIGPEDFHILKKYNIVGSVTPSHGLTVGLNHKENHEKCLDAIRKSIDATADAGFNQVICFSGNRKGISEEEGLKNCADALKQVVGYAEEKKITLIMELLNSRRDHKDYQCDTTAWGVSLCKAVGSERFKLLYDIYHMQVQEGNIIENIRKNHQYIAHYHTAGVPGRNELDPKQELNYPAIVQAIIDTGYKGWLSHEFIPKRDPATSLAEAVKLCDI